MSGLRVRHSLHVAGRMLQGRSPECPHATLWPEGRRGRSSESGSREAMGSKLMWIQPSNQYWPPPTSTAHAPSQGPPPAYCHPPAHSHWSLGTPTSDHSPLHRTLCGSTSLRLKGRVLPVPTRPHTVWSGLSPLPSVLPKQARNIFPQGFCTAPSPEISA